MNVKKSTRDAGIGISFFISTVIHLAVFLLLLWWYVFFPATVAVEATYYVDVVNLPVVAPRSGSPSQRENTAEVLQPPPSVPDNKMSLPPTKKPQTKAAQTIPPKAADKTKTPDESEAFAKKMANLQGAAESRQQEETIERLRRKVSNPGSGKAGMPAGAGNEVGSDYLNFITSRLTEVFSEPPNTNKNVSAVIKIRIDNRGKVETIRIIKSSGDGAFDNYAIKSVYEAEKKFPPPPTGNFEFNFRFKPQGVSQK